MAPAVTTPLGSAPVFFSAGELRNPREHGSFGASTSSASSSSDPVLKLPPVFGEKAVSYVTARRSNTLAGFPVVVAQLPQEDGSVVSLPSLPGLTHRVAITRTPSMPTHVLTTPREGTLGSEDEEDAVRVKRSATTSFEAVGHSEDDAAEEDHRDGMTLEGWVQQRLANILGMEGSLRAFSLRRADHVEAATSRRHLRRGAGGVREGEGGDDQERVPSARHLLSYSYVKTIKRLTSRNTTKVLHQAASVAEDYLADMYDPEPLSTASTFSVDDKRFRASASVVPEFNPTQHRASNNSEAAEDSEPGSPSPLRASVQRAKLLRRTQSTR